ncbi:MAG: hypothetical protein JSV86_08465 [Gemmatimonadota bacterium]|nr:MAG: hypothetical protein JSV86_08465 [Gemmatimonadota bacterium]
MSETKRLYRVTIRYRRQVQQYEVFEVEAADLRDAVLVAADRFGDVLAELADLIEIRVAHPAE